jgi:plastocyanin domain-containing protein
MYLRHWSTWVVLIGLVLWWALLYSHSGQSDIWGPDHPTDIGANGAMAYARVLVITLAVAPALVVGALLFRRRR